LPRTKHFNGVLEVLFLIGAPQFSLRVCEQFCSVISLSSNARCNSALVAHQTIAVLIAERLFVRVAGFSQPQRRYLMTKLKLLAAAAALSTVMVAPAMAQQVYHRGYDGYRDRGPVDAAVGIAGFAVGTAAAIATAPLRDSYAYDNGYGYDSGYAARNGFVCQPGTWFRGEDGRRHLCQ
jgi:hypothetical protein